MSFGTNSSLLGASSESVFNVLDSYHSLNKEFGFHISDTVVIRKISYAVQMKGNNMLYHLSRVDD